MAVQETVFSCHLVYDGTDDGTDDDSDDDSGDDIDIGEERFPRAKGPFHPIALLRGIAPLQAAAYMNRIQVARKLLDRGADPNAAAANKSGITAIELAACGGHLEMIRLLLEIPAVALAPLSRAIQFAKEREHWVVADRLKGFQESLRNGAERMNAMV